jgi:hypothetical protein
MKTLLVILVLSELFLLVLAFSPIFIDRRSAAQALVEWRNNPIPENEAAWFQESAAMRREHLITETGIYGLLALNTAAVILLVKRVRRESKNLSA